MRVCIKILICGILFSLSSISKAQTIYSLKIETREEIPKRIIKSYINSKGDSLYLMNKLSDLIFDLQKKGFWAASVDSVRYDSINMYAQVYRGNKYTIHQINLKSLPEDVLDFLPARQKKQNKLNSLQDFKNKLLDVYLNSGYPFANVYFDSVRIQNNKVDFNLHLEKGNHYTIDSIIIKGKSKISQLYVEKTIEISSGDDLNQSKLDNISAKIESLSFLQEIKPSEIEFKSKTVDLYLYLKNRKANSFNGIIGFSPKKEKTEKLLVTGELNLNLINSFKHGETIFLNWEKLESSTQNLDLGFAYPYLFKTNLGLDTKFGLFKKDSTYLSLKSNLGLRFFLNSKDYVKTYYKYKRTARIGDKQNVSVIDFADIHSNILGVAFYRNTLDYKFNPRKGYCLDLFGGVGFKNIANTGVVSDSLNVDLDNKTTEIEAGVNFDLYLPVYGNFIFHLGHETRYLDQFSDKETLFFENELYRFGGARSLRGFDENIFYASIYSIQNIELKYLFEKNSSFYVFCNGAYYYQDIARVTNEDFPWGFGVGLDFDTKAGIFSLSYALGKQANDLFEIRTAKIHFGYISRF